MSLNGGNQEQYEENENKFQSGKYLPDWKRNRTIQNQRFQENQSNDVSVNNHVQWTNHIKRKRNFPTFSYRSYPQNAPPFLIQE